MEIKTDHDQKYRLVQRRPPFDASANVSCLMQVLVPLANLPTIICRLARRSGSATGELRKVFVGEAG